MTLADPLLELTKSQTLFRGSREDLETLKTTFDRQHWLRLPQFVAPDLLRRIQNDLAAGEFRAKVHEGIGRELVTGPDGAFAADVSGQRSPFVRVGRAHYRLSRHPVLHRQDLPHEPGQ